MPAAVSTQRLRGWVRSFRGTWGFLNGDGFEGDLFVGLKGNPHLKSLAQDDQVEFDIKTDDHGKSEAVNVTVRTQGPSGGDGTSPSLTGESRYTGWVRSFSDQWGFINSDAFAGDLFIGLKSNSHLVGLTVNEQVEFEIRTDDRGKTEAVNVRPLNTPSASPSVPIQTGPVTRAQVANLTGNHMTGKIKSFRDNWGFVNSDTFGGDLFIHAKSNPELGFVGPGDPIQFEIAEDSNSAGGYHAVGAVLLKDDIHNLVGEHLRGWVKSFKDSWGLLNSNRFDGDVFVGTRANPQLGIAGLQQGECVEFEVAKDDKAKNGLHAVKVKRLAESVPAPMPTPTPTTAEHFTQGSTAQRLKAEALVGHRAKGIIRSFRDGWGFVVSDDFDGDLFLHQGSNPGSSFLQVGDNITFEIALGSGGKCHATRVQTVASELKDLVGRTCVGKVRSFHDNWGFVTSSKYPGDLFIGMRTNPQLAAPLKPGDQIEFLVQKGANSNKYEAAQVKIIGSALTGAAVPSTAPSINGVSQGRSPTPSVAIGLAVSRGRSRSPRGMTAAVQATAPSSRPATGRDPASMVGSILAGKVKSFRGGWGFVNAGAFDGDLFIGGRSNPQLSKELQGGDQVSFRVSMGPGGKTEAVDVQLL